MPRSGSEPALAEVGVAVTWRSAWLMRLDYDGVAVGDEADLVVHNCADPATSVAELGPPVFCFKRGRRTFTREPAVRYMPR